MEVDLQLVEYAQDVTANNANQNPDAQVDILVVHVFVDVVKDAKDDKQEANGKVLRVEWDPAIGRIHQNDNRHIDPNRDQMQVVVGNAIRQT